MSIISNLVSWITGNRTVDNNQQNSQEYFQRQEQLINDKFTQFFNERDFPESPAINALKVSTRKLYDEKSIWGNENDLEISKLACKVLSKWFPHLRNNSSASQEVGVRSVKDTLELAKNYSLENIWKEVNDQLSEKTGLPRNSFPSNATEIRRWLEEQKNIEMLECITSLSIKNSNLTFFPAEISKLSSLTELSLNYNKFAALELPNMPNLKYLNLSRNNIDTISLSNVPNLEYLNLSDNRLDGNLELSIPNLKSLNLSFNKMGTGNKFQESHLPKLEKLFLTKNKIGNNFHLPDLPNLKVLDLSKNILERNYYLPISLSQLEVLNLSFNFLDALLFSNSTFKLPSYLSELKTLNLTNNGLKKENVELSNLPKLEHVDYSNVFLNGYRSCSVYGNAYSFLHEPDRT